MVNVKPKRKEGVGISFRIEVLERIDKLAERIHSSRSYLVDRIISEHIDEFEREYFTPNLMM